MTIEKKLFSPYKEQEERDGEKSKVITIRLNVDELKDLEELGKLLRQEKLGTVIKQLMKVGSLVLHSPETAYLTEVLFKNEDNNKRNGIITVNPKFKNL